MVFSANSTLTRIATAIMWRQEAILAAILIAFIYKFAVWGLNNWELLSKIAGENPFIQVVITSGALGFFWSVYDRVHRQAQQYLNTNFWCSVKIRSSDENYKKVLDYLSCHFEVKTGCKQAYTKKSENQTWRDRHLERTFGKKAPKLEWRPDDAAGSHFMQYEGQWITLDLEKGKTITTGYDRRPMEMATLVLSMWGPDDSLLQKLVQEAVDQTYKVESQNINIYVQSNDWWDGWEKAMSKQPRSNESVILDASLKAELLQDARDFIASEDWYKDKGIPYRRGYLLHGPPGCGKTSFAQVMANELRLDICMLTLSNQSLDDDLLSSLLRDAPKRCLLVLEDVDALFVERGKDEKSGNRLTFSGLLNALDGVASQEGRIYFLTTNHIEKLDPALIRPGRCDVKVEIKRATAIQAKRMFQRFYPTEPESMAQQFADSIPEFELSMAQIQGHLLEFKKTPKLAIESINKLLLSRRPSDELDSMIKGQTPLFEYMKRFALEQYASIFEFYGFYLKRQLADLSPERVANWHPEFNLGSKDFELVKKMLGSEIPDEFQLANLAQLRDIFIATFFTGAKLDEEDLKRKKTANAWEAISERMPDDPSLCPDDKKDDLEMISMAVAQSSSSLKRQTSGHQVSGLRQRRKDNHLETLSKMFAKKVSKGGRVLVSVFQVRNFLARYADDPELAVKHASVLIRSRKDTPQVQHMGLAEYLWRMGHEKHYWEVRDKLSGNDSMAELPFGGDAEEILDEMDLSEPALLKQMKQITSGASCREAVKLQFLTPPFPLTVHRIKAFYGLTFSAARAVARRLYPTFGYKPQFSLMRLEELMRSNPRGLQFAGTLQPPAPESIPKPEVHTDCWVYKWLEGEGLEKYARAFTAKGLLTREDVCEPEIYQPSLPDAPLRDERRFKILVKKLEKEIEKEKEARQKAEEEAKAKAAKEKAARENKDDGTKPGAEKDLDDNKEAPSSPGDLNPNKATNAIAMKGEKNRVKSPLSPVV